MATRTNRSARLTFGWAAIVAGLLPLGLFDSTGFWEIVMGTLSWLALAILPVIAYLGVIREPYLVWTLGPILAGVSGFVSLSFFIHDPADGTNFAPIWFMLGSIPATLLALVLQGLASLRRQRSHENSEGTAQRRS